MEQTEHYQQAMERGHSAAWDQEWDRAVKYYAQALEEFPEDSKALISLGLAYFEMREYPRALEVYQEAARVSADDPIPVEKAAQIYELLGEEGLAAEAALRSAELYLKKGDLSKSIENWSRVTYLDPENVPARSRLALAHERLGKKQQAVTEYINLASVLQRSGKGQEAIQVVNHAIRLMPGSKEARQALMMLQSNQPLPRPARPRRVEEQQQDLSVPQIEAPRAEEDTDPDQSPIEESRKDALAELAGMLFELSDEKDEERPSRRGLQELTQGFSLGDGRSDRAGMMYRLRQAVDSQIQGQDDEAINTLDLLVESGLDLPAVHYCLGMLRARQQDLEEAQLHLQRAVKQPNLALGARLLLGQSFQDLGRYEEAAVEYLEALRIADSEVVPSRQAAALRQLYEPLIEAHVQEADEEAHQTLCENIQELLIRENWREHLANARRELPVQDPDAPPAPLAEILTQAQSSQIVGALATIHQYARSGYLSMAMEEAFRALDYAPTYLPLHALMGDLLIQENLIEEAIDKFATVAKAYNARGETVRSIEIFRRIVNLSPMDLTGRQRLIDHLIQSGDFEAALKEHMELAEVYIRLAELDRARETFEAALRLAQQAGVDRAWSVRILHMMADLDLQRLDWRQALRTYEQVRRLDPGDEEARISLVDLNLRMGQEAQALTELDQYVAHLQATRREDQILKVMESLAESHPNVIDIRRRLAQLYEHLGRIDDAVAAWDHVGDQLLSSGDTEGAILAIRAIVALNPPNVQEYQRVLSELTGSA